MKKQYLHITAILFVILFSYTAAAKGMDYVAFRNYLNVSPLLGAWSSVLFWLIPVSELSVAILLVIPSCRNLGLYISFALMVIFTAYIIVMLTIFEKYPCSCGGVIEQMSWHQHLVFNCIFTLFSGLAIYFIRTKKYRDEHIVDQQYSSR